MHLNLPEWASSARSALQDLLLLQSQPNVTSFALGLPSADLFPSSAIAQATVEVLSETKAALQYGPPSKALRKKIAGIMHLRGVKCDGDEIFLTTGGQQGLSLLSRLLVSKKTLILAEELVYPGFRQAAQVIGGKLQSIPGTPSGGLDIERLSNVLRKRPGQCMLYVIADGSNPTGRTLSREQRIELVKVAQEYGCIIIEDDPYGLLTYSGDLNPALRSFEGDGVFYVGSFSKIISPGLRTGWILAPSRAHAGLAVLKEATDIDMVTLGQRIICRLLTPDFLGPHLDRLRCEYRTRRDAMLQALGRYFPESALWTVPPCGFFVWVTLPHGVDTTVLLKEALVRERVAFLPGSAFSVAGEKCSGMRLAFSTCTPAEIEDGICRLGHLIGRIITK